MSTTPREILSLKFEDLRRKEELGSEEFISAGYHAHEVILDFVESALTIERARSQRLVEAILNLKETCNDELGARWQFDQMKGELDRLTRELAERDEEILRLKVYKSAFTEMDNANKKWRGAQKIWLKEKYQLQDELARYKSALEEALQYCEPAMVERLRALTAQPKKEGS